MTDIGVEVGQKMRSAIKAKLMELECYVDDELPDYIMVMVANKRTKSQMNDDLQLFLGSKTVAFVDWLHIVLKKLKEVHVTNPNVFKKTVKRKSEEIIDIKNVKKEKKDAKFKKIKKKEPQRVTLNETKSLTDDLPLNINKTSESRKIILMQENQNAGSSNVQSAGDFCYVVPSLSEVNSSSESELRMLENQIKNVKSRLGLVVQSDSDEDFLNIKAEPDELFPNEQSLIKRGKQKQNETARKICVVESSTESSTIIANTDSNKNVLNQKEHARIIFDLSYDKTTKKKSVLDRLGKRYIDTDDDIDFRTGLKKSKISLSKIRKEEEEIFGVKRNAINAENENTVQYKNETRGGKNEREDKPEKEKKESALNRLGVLSKVAVPQRKQMAFEEKEEENLVSKDVPSAVKVKPRVIPPNAQQANKNLLLKAVAEAQRSIAQTPPVGTNMKPDALFTKKFQQKISEKNFKRTLPDTEKNKLKNMISHITRDDKLDGNVNSDSEEIQYVPKPVKKLDQKPVEYIPSSKESLNTCDESTSEKQTFNQNFIVTLDGIDKTKYAKTPEKLTEKTKSNSKKRSPSPIVFDKVSTPVKKIVNIPDKLPLVHSSPSIKNKERCKYWPSCRQGDKCEFVHPTSHCKLFPQCKFGEKCLYIHPNCKFESSCTRRDCPYNHVNLSKAAVASRIVSTTVSLPLPKPSLQTCKFFPHCNNTHCTFYHPRPCKFGKFCKNQSECNFSHTYVPKNSNMIWRSDFKQ